MSRAPTAAERTISLFTGKTDLESENARDGSPPELPANVRAYRPLKWRAVGLTRWTTNRRREGTEIVEYEIYRDQRYPQRWAHGPGLRLTSYPTIQEAGNAVIAAHTRGGR